MQITLEDFQSQLREFEAGLPAAGVRQVQYADYDPYPDIPPALLSAGHAAAYVMITGMIDPFDPSEFNKPATYRVPIEGPVRFKDDKNNIHNFILTNTPELHDQREDVRSSFTLKPNSICYLTLKPKFKIPSYIAIRFNLTIKEVYRGLLVGTGPLVDPGFDGNLYVPIHNLTNNEYILRAGEGFVYFEFTKLSWSNPPEKQYTPSWFKPVIHDQPPFPSRKKKRKTIDDYLDEATSSGPAESSLTRYEELLKQTRLRLGIITLGGGVAALVLIISCWQIYAAAQSFAQDARLHLESKIESLRNEVDALRMSRVP